MPGHLLNECLAEVQLSPVGQFQRSASGSYSAPSEARDLLGHPLLGVRVPNQVEQHPLQGGGGGFRAGHKDVLQLAPEVPEAVLAAEARGVAALLLRPRRLCSLRQEALDVVPARVGLAERDLGSVVNIT